MQPSHILFSAIALILGLTACGKENKAKDANKTATTTSSDVIRIATEGAYPPMNFTNSDGSLSGFDIEIVNALCTQMKTKCEVVAQDWEGIIPGLQAKKYDAIIAGMSITDERKNVVDFTDPYFSSGLLLIAKDDSAISTETLSGKTIGAQKATVASNYLEENNPDAEVSLYDTQENSNMDLVSGRLDAILVDQVVGTDWLSSDNSKGYEQKGKTIFTGKDDLGIAVRKGDDLANKFNSALKEIKANGTYETISTKYFHTEK